MSTKHDSQCLLKAGDDEPIFVLRAKDPAATQTIVNWISLNIGVQPHDKLMQAAQVAHDMEKWRKENI